MKKLSINTLIVLLKAFLKRINLTYHKDNCNTIKLNLLSQRKLRKRKDILANILDKCLKEVAEEVEEEVEEEEVEEEEEEETELCRLNDY